MPPDRAPACHEPACHDRGRVSLVGAGPGPADLLTLRAAKAIQTAQALLYDALIGDDILALAPQPCLKIQTGKRAGRPSMKQQTINRLMLRLARRGLRVVRLKGGDPSVFGRVGEEIEFLRAHGIPVDVVPGVTAACAAAAQFQFPLTHRSGARRVVFATARIQAGELVGDWRVAADPQATVAIYMGGQHLVEIANRLIGAGRAPSTPILMIESVGDPSGRLTSGTLASFADAAPQRSGGPILIVVGQVAAGVCETEMNRPCERLAIGG